MGFQISGLAMMRWGAVACVAMGLAACQPLGAGGQQGAAVDATTGSSTRLVERDVEAPDVFAVTDQGLWDGRPSLGGVWVAHPAAQDPERVIIRNEANGRFVIGALFRRERDNPGPALQVSSDAASALGLLAGAPATLNVTALRREEVAEGAQDAPAAIATGSVDYDSAVATSPLAAPPQAAPAAVATSAPPAPVAAPAPAVASNLDRPFVQIGIFAVQANATNTAEALRNAGLSPIIKDETSNGRRFWRVVVGPAASTDERARNLDAARRLGFGDAYAVRN